MIQLISIIWLFIKKFWISGEPYIIAQGNNLRVLRSRKIVKPYCVSINLKLLVKFIYHIWKISLQDKIYFGLLPLSYFKKNIFVCSITHWLTFWTSTQTPIICFTSFKGNFERFFVIYYTIGCLTWCRVNFSKRVLWNLWFWRFCYIVYLKEN